MNQHPISTSTAPSSENAQVRLKPWQERFAELLCDLEAFLPPSELSLKDSQGVPLCSLPPSHSQPA